MKRNWNKKRIIQLSHADPQTVEQWLDAYVHFIYTWLYFQVGADADIAADITARTFTGALRELDQFSPDQQTMLQWLRERAVDARDEGLLHWQMKPQRPWAWSQLPKAVLDGLSRIRSEPLSEDVTNNPFVQEIVQAAIAEMEQIDHTLMKYRYNRLETPEHIADEVGLSISDVNDRLYQCRHFFRRVLIQLIQSENPGFAETTAAGSLELLDTNFEKLLSSTDMVQPISDKHRAVIREKLLEAAREIAQTKSTQSGEKPYAIRIAAGAAALVLIAVVVWIILFSSRPATESEPAIPPTPPRQQTTPSTTEKPKTTANEQQPDQEELKRVFLLGQADDLRGLLEVLRNGSYDSQIIAAAFIGGIGDESAIGLLEESEAKWYPNGPSDNPFSQAIIQIENRLLAQTGTVEEPNETKPAPQAIEAAEKEAPPAAPPAIAGTVTDYSGRPLSNARVTLMRNPLYGDAAEMEILNQTQTDNQGQYLFSKEYEGPVFIECQVMPDGDMTIRQARWCRKDTPCRADFGGTPSVFGTLNPETEPSFGQLLYLSNTLDPANASFLTETIVDGAGQFSFIGIAPGTYYLLNKTADNRIVWIDTLQVTDNDIADWQIGRLPVNLTVQFERTEASPAIVGGILTYGPDVSTDLLQLTLQLQEDGIYRFDNAPAGNYLLITRFENGMRLQQPAELNESRTLTVTVPEGTASLSGQFKTNPGALKLFLSNTDQRVRFDLLPDANKFYSLESVPADTYSLAAVINGLQLELMDVDLQSESAQVLDIDPEQWVQNFSPLYVVVTDAGGILITGAQAWVTGPAQTITAQSTGRGAFLAVPPGDYTVYAAMPGFPTAEKQIQVPSAPLTSPPGPNNTIWLQLGTTEKP